VSEAAPNPRTRERLLVATLACVERWGLGKTSLEDIANEAGLSRATVYRYFPGGREQLVSDTVRWEVERFWLRLYHVVEQQPDLATKLEAGLAFGHQAIGDHQLLQRLLRTEPEALFAELNQTDELVRAAVRRQLDLLLANEALRDGLDREEAADYLSRMFLAFLGSPGRWDLTDPGEVARLVRTQFLAGILARP
jgi:AcrR family transcriptional regulator